jgi:hypothetical protein
MRGRILFVAGVALGYVLGTRRGRQGYVELKDRAQSLWRSPQVQTTVHKAQAVIEDKAPALSAKAADVADKTKATLGEAQSVGD